MVRKAHGEEKLPLDRAIELALELKAQGREDDALRLARMVALLEEQDMPRKVRSALKAIEKLPEDPEWEERFFKDLEGGRFHPW